MKKIATAVLLFLITIVFSAVPPAFAHDGPDAEDASSGDMDDMRNFLLHLKEHRGRISSDDSQAEFRNALRTDNGVWRHGDTYVITVNKSGDGEVPSSAQSGDIIFFHAKHPAAVSGSLSGIAIFQDLIDKVEATDGEAVCVQDTSRKYGNHICAVEDSDPAGFGAGVPFIQIVGFNHERNEADLSKAEDACPDFTAEDLRSKGWLSADMVNDEQSLMRYLEGVVEHVSEEIGNAPGQSGNNEGVSLLRMVQLMPCWRELPWESGSIYFYIVTDTDKMFGIFNGNTPQLQDRTLRLVDDNGVEIAKRILEEVRRQDDTPNRGFLTYLWDDPTVVGDEVVCQQREPVPGPFAEDEDEEVFCEVGSPVPGRSTGTSVKRGYFIRTNFGVGETYYVVGSGIYPKSGEADGGGGGGGCAITSESAKGTGIPAFNLFLSTAVLFLAIFWGRRPGEEFLGENGRRGD